ncbi:MAG: Crp/Fnr family transcriptional regulator [Alphaproteobacteria bacterium]|nr:MAG: Crp/Fnr family transcriptional regulator [Alphaproteobacteria bacterium]
MTILEPVPGRSVPCEACPFRTNPTFRDFSPPELEFISAFKSGELNAEVGTTLFLEDTNSPHLYTVLAGWAFRYKMLPDGRRQILNFALPGDFLGLQTSVFDKMGHSAEALTDMVLCIFPREKLWELFSGHPSLSFDVTWLAAREERVLDENLLSVGRRSALERMAYVLLHLFRRAEDLGLTKGDRIEFPFFQQHLADMLGMSLVHANNTLRRLTSQKVVHWKQKVFRLLDRDRLAEIAGYEFAERQPRPFI